MSTVTEIDTRSLDRAAFRDRLVAAVDQFRYEDTRLCALLHSGRCPKPLLLRYALATYSAAHQFLASLSEMIELAPSAKARLVLLENLLEEEGIFLRPSAGLIVRPEKRHPALALRFVKACGGDGTMIDSEVKHSIGRGRELLADGRWLEAAAHLLVGQEYKFPAVAEANRLGLLKCGFSEHDIAFFTVHIDDDKKHGEEALDLVLDHATTRDEQEAAIWAAADGARIWFDLHGGSARSSKAAQ
ncbi:MAG: iron-containing redox enzyme family protein [Sphingopyxis sp.]